MSFAHYAAVVSSRAGALMQRRGRRINMCMLTMDQMTDDQMSESTGKK